MSFDAVLSPPGWLPFASPGLFVSLLLPGGVSVLLPSPGFGDDGASAGFCGALLSGEPPGCAGSLGFAGASGLAPLPGAPPGLSEPLPSGLPPGLPPCPGFAGAGGGALVSPGVGGRVSGLVPSPGFCGLEGGVSPGFAGLCGKELSPPAGGLLLPLSPGFDGPDGPSPGFGGSGVSAGFCAAGGLVSPGFG